MNMKCHICDSYYKLYNSEIKLFNNEIKNTYCCNAYNTNECNTIDCHSFISFVNGEIVLYDILILLNNITYVLTSDKIKKYSKVLVAPDYKLLLETEYYYEPVIKDNLLKMDDLLKRFLKLQVFI